MLSAVSIAFSNAHVIRIDIVLTPCLTRAARPPPSRPRHFCASLMRLTCAKKRGTKLSDMDKIRDRAGRNLPKRQRILSLVITTLKQANHISPVMSIQAANTPEAVASSVIGLPQSRRKTVSPLEENRGLIRAVMTISGRKKASVLKAFRPLRYMKYPKEQIRDSPRHTGWLKNMAKEIVSAKNSRFTLGWYWANVSLRAGLFINFPHSLFIVGSSGIALVS